MRLYDLDWNAGRNESRKDDKKKFLASSLYYASMLDLQPIVSTLLKHGADANVQGGWYGTALQAAVVQGHIETVRLLLNCGVDVNAQGGEFGTALQAAAMQDNIEMMRLLLNHNADVNLRAGFYGTVLQAAVEEGGIETMQLLRQHGAVYISDLDENSNFEYTSEEGEAEE